MKSIPLLLTVLLEQLTRTTAQLITLQLAPGTHQQPSPSCASFLGTTADGNHQLFNTSPCPPSIDHHGDPPFQLLSFHPQKGALIYSIKYHHTDVSERKLLEHFISHFEKVGNIIPEPGGKPPIESPSLQWVLKPDSPPRIRTLFYEPLQSSAVLVEVPPQLVGLFAELLPAKFDSIRHPLAPSALHGRPDGSSEPAAKILPNISSSSLAGRLARLHYRPQIDQILRLSRGEKLLKDIEFLGGGEGKEARWMTRHSFSDGALQAVEWLKNRYQALGARCEFDQYLLGVAPNLICKLSWSVSDQTTQNPPDGGPLESIVLTAHYDSKGSFGSIRAPGVDDNASGCAVLLSIADILQKESDQFLKKARSIDQNSALSGRRVEVVFVHFSGTEQGLLGSRSVAKRFRDDQLDGKQHQRMMLLLMNVDMISYRVKGEPVQMGLSTLGSSTASREFIRRVSNIYAPELLVGNCTIGLSDETNFHINGFPDSVRIFERIGSSIRNPDHLRSSDDFSHFFDLDQDDGRAPEGSYDILQTLLIARVVLASVLELLLS